MKTYDLAGAVIYNMDPEFATSEKLKDLIIGHVLAMDGEKECVLKGNGCSFDESIQLCSFG